jgi:transcription elongation factor GreA
LFRAIGLMPDGPALLGRPIRASGPGVYLIELTEARATAPIDLAAVGLWIERVPTLKLDGEGPTSKALAARLAAFWLPSQTVVYVGSTESSIAYRIDALSRHVLGDRRPHAASGWLKVLAGVKLRVWWASTNGPEEYEDGLLEAFAAGVPSAEAAALHDPEVVLPFANLRSTLGTWKRHGIAGSVLPDEPVSVVPRRIVHVEPGDAEGARTAPRGTGTTRRSGRGMTNGTPVKRSRPSKAVSPKPLRPPPEPVYLSADGLTRLQEELDELVRIRRPRNVASIRAAKELGDLKENSDYQAAREEQSFLEGRIQALEARIRAAVVVAATGDSSRVAMGSRVSIEADGQQQAWTIVGSDESDPGAGRISHASPVGRALLGRSVGDVAVVQTPRGQVSYRILAIE